MNRRNQSGGWRTYLYAARQALQTWLLIGLFVLAPPRASAQTTFAEAQPVDEGAPLMHALAVIDFDGDGDPDLVAITANGESADDLVWFENDGEGQFAPAQTLLTGLRGSNRALEAADLDGDGDPDVLVGDGRWVGSGGLFWAANEGGQLSALQVIEPVESGPFITIDFDGDGDLDVIQGGLYVSLYENMGGSGGSLFRRTRALAAGPSEALGAADFDGDGDADLVASHRSYERYNDIVLYYEQDGGSGPIVHNFSRTLPGVSSSQDVGNRFVSIIEVVDVDFDGKADVVLGGYLNEDLGPENGYVLYYRNIGLQGFPVAPPARLIASQPRESREPWGPVALTVADFDGDGDGDIAFSKTRFDLDSLVWYENLLTSVQDRTAWPEHVVGLVDRHVLTMQAADLNLDGALDLVTIEGALTFIAGRLVWYENLGPGGTATEGPQGDASLVPGSLKLEAVWPNPSSGAVTVEYKVGGAVSVRLEVFDVLGRLVATYEEHPQHAGSYQAELNLSALAAGTYVLRIQAEGYGEATRRIVLQ